MNESIVRIAARGDGVTPSGRHVPFGVPGDAVLDDGALAFGPHHQEPPCRHFPQCGGCQLQHADDEAYRGYLVSRVETALAQHSLETQIRAPHLSPPNSRRRATLKALKVASGVQLGFNAEMSHRIVDMRECHILRPELFALIEPLRQVLADMLQPKRIAEIQLTLIDRGPDVSLKGVPAGRLAEIEQLTSFATKPSERTMSMTLQLAASETATCATRGSRARAAASIFWQSATFSANGMTASGSSAVYIAWFVRSGGGAGWPFAGSSNFSVAAARSMAAALISLACANAVVSPETPRSPNPEAVW